MKLAYVVIVIFSFATHGYSSGLLEKCDPFEVYVSSTTTPLNPTGKYIVDILKRAKARNLFTLLDLNALKTGPETFREIDDYLALSEERIKENWEYFEFNKIKYINDSWWSVAGIEFIKDHKTEFIPLHVERLQLLAASLIAYARHKKTGIKINLEALKSKRRQQYLDHKHLMKVIMKRPHASISADTVIFFQ